MIEVVNVADLRDPNDPAGRSYRQVNAEKTHSIPLGALVEIKGTCERLYVVIQGRDCDQTPLYWLSLKDNEEDTFLRDSKRFGGYCEENLTVIRRPDSASARPPTPER